MNTPLRYTASAQTRPSRVVVASGYEPSGTGIIDPDAQDQVRHIASQAQALSDLQISAKNPLSWFTMREAVGWYADLMEVQGAASFTWFDQPNFLGPVANSAQEIEYFSLVEKGPGPRAANGQRPRVRKAFWEEVRATRYAFWFCQFDLEDTDRTVWVAVVMFLTHEGDDRTAFKIAIVDTTITHRDRRRDRIRAAFSQYLPEGDITVHPNAWVVGANAGNQRVLFLPRPVRVGSSYLSGHICFAIVVEIIRRLRLKTSTTITTYDEHLWQNLPTHHKYKEILAMLVGAIVERGRWESGMKLRVSFEVPGRGSDHDPDALLPRRSPTAGRVIILDEDDMRNSSEDDDEEEDGPLQSSVNVRDPVSARKRRAINLNRDNDDYDLGGGVSRRLFR